MTRNPSVRRGLAALSAIALVVLGLLAGIWLGGHPSNLPSALRGGFFESRSLMLVNQALNILTTRYYRPLDRSALVDEALSGMVVSLDDPYSHYLDPRAYRARNEERNQPEVGGIGITTVAESGGLRVVSVVENSPAAAAGLMAGDVIVKVGSTSLADQAENVGTDLIRGPIGTPVELTFLRGENRHVISLTRATIVVPVARRQMLDYHGVPIGHLTLTGFPEGAGDKLRAQVQAALGDGAKALILDLRGNGGGLISEAINVASAFIPHGKIMSAEERGQAPRVYMARGDAIAAHVPLVVLVDHGTASASEIVTAALQDSGRAQVVGTETYGKGVFQVTERLVNGGALDLTVGKYFGPNGHNLGGGGARPGAGITPNVYAVDDPQTAPDEALAAAERTVAAEAP
jgi:carboxyl-terminal processing protease